MANRLAKFYVMASAAIASLALAILVALHIWALRGNAFSLPHIFALGMIAGLPLLGLAKERNIWANEMRALPAWVRTLVFALFAYYFFVFAVILIVGDIRNPFGASVLFSSFFVVFLAGLLCVPFALLKPNNMETAELNKRVFRSLGLLAAGILIATLSHFDLLPKRHSTQSFVNYISQDFNV